MLPLWQKRRLEELKRKERMLIALAAARKKAKERVPTLREDAGKHQPLFLLLVDLSIPKPHCSSFR